MIKNILVTGGTGFIGSHVVEALLNENFNVIILKRQSSDIWRIKNFLEKIVSYDIDKIDLRDIFKENQINAVIHLATYYKKYHNYDDIEKMIYSNIAFPTKILDLCVEYDVKYFINTGTFFEYDISTLPVSENEKKKAFNLYSSTKISFEEILSFYGDKVKCVTLKIFSPYGEKDNDYKLIPTLINKAIKNEEIYLSEGFQKLDFIYVKDIANAYIKAIKSMKEIDSLESFNIGTGFPYSIREIVSLIQEILDKEINVVWGDSAQDIPICYADIAKAKEILKWQPLYSLREGLSRTIEYYKKVHQ
jgi:nucleoside-diphosphate-sugar epimerase